MRNKRSKTKGVSLAELLIAISVLAATLGPIMGMFMWSSQASIKAYKVSIASVVAEMRMEELVGTELLTEDMVGMVVINPGPNPRIYERSDKGFRVKIEIYDLDINDLDDDLKTALGGDSSIIPSRFSKFLKMVTITVSDNDGAVLCTQRNIINTAINGFYIDPLNTDIT